MTINLRAVFLVQALFALLVSNCRSLFNDPPPLRARPSWSLWALTLMTNAISLNQNAISNITKPRNAILS